MKISEKEKERMLEQRRQGVIILCSNCYKIDIDPDTHFEVCNPTYEEHRREQQEVDWE